MRILIALLALLAGFPATAGNAGARAADPPRAVPGQLVLGFEAGTTIADRDRIVSALGGQTLWELGTLPVRLVELPQGRAGVASALPPGLRYAEPNYVIDQQATPNDQGMAGLWGLHNTGQPIREPGVADADIDAPEAWDITTGSQGIVVGILDSGVDYSHPDLAANLWTAPAGWTIPQYPACGPGSHGIDTSRAASHQVYDCAPQDENGHGTHVAGTIGAVGNNGTGITGVNWRTRMMILKDGGAEPEVSLFNTAIALDYALLARDRGINLRVINGSFGGGADQYTQLLYDLIDAANDRNILFVAAAGNIGNNNDVTPFYPASFNLPNVIAVAATDNRDRLASFSNYGAGSVDLAAPGVDILSTYPTYPVAVADTLSYGVTDGTSMAAPHVAGAAALVLAAPGLGGLTTAQLKQRLLDCGDPIPALAGRTATGKRLNVHRAITGCAGGFSDVPPSHPYYEAITTLAAAGIIRGYQDGRFGPGDGVQRAQMAALIARAVPAGPGTPPRTLTPPACLAAGTWDCEDWGNQFSDPGGIDPNLWRNAGTLQHYQVALGYSAADCARKGRAFPCFGPTDPVSHAQTISFITRALVAKGLWQPQPGAAHPYGGVPAAHEADFRTYHHYTASKGGVPVPPNGQGWNAQAIRGWFAQTLWQALR